MIVRDIEPHEIKSILRLGCAHPDNRNIPGGLDTEYFIAKFTDLFESKVAHIFGMFLPDGTVTGAMGFMAIQDMFNSDLVAIECFWFIFPKWRGRGLVLLREYEKRAAALGCKRIQMPHQVKRQPEGFGQFFARRGYEVNEISYLKTLN